MQPNEAPFELGEWVVQPQLNRLSRCGGADLQIEPKMMDVLVCLWRHSGDVVSRDALIDAVWPDLFISESVLTRAIAGLRRALGDDARRPEFIETIAKRGYRLITGPRSTPVVSPSRSTVVVPGGSYVVGQWVRAEGFYGRAAQLAEVLDGPRCGFWVVGTRRRGKTSFLKQLEHIAVTQPERQLAPVFWDLQGAEDADDLLETLEDALADVEPRLGESGIELSETMDRDVVRLLGNLRRRLNASGRHLLLLCDEAEELLQVAANSQTTIRRLRRALLSHDGMRTVLASGPRLWNLATGTSTSPFLDGFLPPLYLGPLAPCNARALVRQNQQTGATGPGLSDEDVETICGWCAGHPFLLQLLSKRVIEQGDVARGVAAVAADRSVTSLFEVDLELLDEQQRQILRAVVRREQPGPAKVGSPALLELHRLGLVETSDAGVAQVALPLFRDWLAGQ